MTVRAECFCEDLEGPKKHSCAPRYGQAIVPSSAHNEVRRDERAKVVQELLTYADELESDVNDSYAKRVFGVARQTELLNEAERVRMVARQVNQNGTV